MTLDTEEKKALSKYRLDKAEKLLDDAKLLLKEKRWESSINRSYCSVTNASLLIDRYFAHNRLNGSSPSEYFRVLIMRLYILFDNLNKFFQIFKRSTADSFS